MKNIWYTAGESQVSKNFLHVDMKSCNFFKILFLSYGKKVMTLMGQWPKFLCESDMAIEILRDIPELGICNWNFSFVFRKGLIYSSNTNYMQVTVKESQPARAYM